MVAGGDNPADGVPAVEARLREPFGVGLDRAGNLFIVEMAGGNRVRKVDTKGILTTYAGTGEIGDAGDGVPALKAQFQGPHSLAVAPNGDVLVADTWNGRIRKIEAQTGIIASVPGFGVTAAQAKSNGPYCIALDFTGTKLYVADLHRVHAIDLKSGTAKVVAGNGQKGVPQDFAMAAQSPLVDPRAVAVDRQGKVYILERGGHALRLVGPGGRIRTVVNASGKKGAEGDGGDALAATMNGPKHLCLDLDDNVIIADAENNIVRKYLPKEGKIVRVAGTGKKGTAGVDGPPEQCELNRPHGVTVHPQTGELYITDSYNNRVLRIVK